MIGKWASFLTTSLAQKCVILNTLPYNSVLIEIVVWLEVSKVASIKNPLQLLAFCFG